MSVAFDGMDNLVVTFRCSGTVEAGSPVILSASDTVADGGTGKAPIGVLLQKRGNYAAVQIRGYVTLPYTGTACLRRSQSTVSRRVSRRSRGR